MTLHTEDLWVLGHEEVSDIAPFTSSFPRISTDQRITDRFGADIICPVHQLHDYDCGICELALFTQVTPGNYTSNLDAADISKLLPESGRVPVFADRPTTSPMGGDANDHGISPSDPTAWATWTKCCHAYFVNEDGLPIH